MKVNLKRRSKICNIMTNYRHEYTEMVAIDKKERKVKANKQNNLERKGFVKNYKTLINNN